MLTLAHTLFNETDTHDELALSAHSPSQTTRIHNIALSSATEEHFRARLAQYGNSPLTIVTHHNLTLLVDRQLQLVAAIQQPDFSAETHRESRYYLSCDESLLPVALRWKLVARQFLHSSLSPSRRVQSLKQWAIKAICKRSEENAAQRQQATTQWHTVRLTA